MQNHTWPLGKTERTAVLTGNGFDKFRGVVLKTEQGCVVAERDDVRVFDIDIIIVTG